MHHFIFSLKLLILEKRLGGKEISAHFTFLPLQGILVQVRSEILSDPNASLNHANSDQAYTEAEARDAFNRMVTRYGWNK